MDEVVLDELVAVELVEDVSVDEDELLVEDVSVDEDEELVEDVSVEELLVEDVSVDEVELLDEVELVLEVEELGGAVGVTVSLQAATRTAVNRASAATGARSFS